MSGQHNNKPSTPLVKPSQRQLEKAAVLFHLIHNCLTLSREALSDLEHQGFTLAEIEGHEIRSIPSETQNIVLSHECLKLFGPSILLASGLFYSFTRSGCICTCLDWSDQCACDGESW